MFEGTLTASEDYPKKLELELKEALWQGMPLVQKDYLQTGTVTSASTVPTAGAESIDPDEGSGSEEVIRKPGGGCPQRPETAVDPTSR